MFLRNIKNKFLYNFLFALRMDECSRVPYAICSPFPMLSHTLIWECSRWCVHVICYTQIPLNEANKKESKHLVLLISQPIIMNILTIGTSLDFRSKSNWCCMHRTFAFNFQDIAFSVWNRKVFLFDLHNVHTIFQVRFFVTHFNFVF